MVVFKTTVRSKWKWSGYTINKLETEAYLIGIRHMASCPRSRGKRIIALVDNTTTLGAVTKGRESPWVLKKLCRKIASVSLSSDLVVLAHWVPSELNLADHSSHTHNALGRKHS